MLRSALAYFAFAITAPGDIPPVHRILPPPGVEIPAAERDALRAELTRLAASFSGLPVRRENANAEIFLKAVRYALELGEFYKPADTAKANELLAEAARRIESLRRGEFPWLEAKGLVVRGYYSPIDGSPQPFGLEIPDDAPAANAPAWVWLRGRADTGTDLHFITERMKKKGQFQPPGCVVVHPFGRHCTGYKNAGGEDVLDVTSLLSREGLIDSRRLALAGFSMGGAGAWLLGSHYPDRWAVVHAGAGFIDVRRYQRLTPDAIASTPPWEQTLWGQNDVPACVRNLLNVPLVAYSGEHDKQRAAAEIMAEELKAQGLTLTHLIGPGMEHKYHPDTQKDVQQRVMEELLKDRPTPQKLHWQGRTLDTARIHWLQVTGLNEHWKDSRVDAVLDAPLPHARTVSITTRNVTSLRLTFPDKETWPTSLTINIDGQTLTGGGSGKAILLTLERSQWKAGPSAQASLRKRPGLQGPIDDAFTAPFLYVLPDAPCASPAVELWLQWELGHQRDRWRWLMRGDVRQKKASAVTADDINRFNLILWGDAAANTVTARVLPDLPVQWKPDGISVGSKSYSGNSVVPVMIHPNPLNPQRYVVLNSGLTFREAHSRTNSLQNPHLPDWAVVDITSPPNDTQPGKVLNAGFFDEQWAVK